MLFLIKNETERYCYESRPLPFGLHLLCLLERVHGEVMQATCVSNAVPRVAFRTPGKPSQKCWNIIMCFARPRLQKHRGRTGPRSFPGVLVVGDVFSPAVAAEDHPAHLVQRQTCAAHKLKTALQPRKVSTCGMSGVAPVAGGVPLHLSVSLRLFSLRPGPSNIMYGLSFLTSSRKHCWPSPGRSGIPILSRPQASTNTCFLKPSIAFKN